MKRKSKGIRVITEETEKDINFLTDVQVEFVSLVRHGANQMPFRVIKSETKGGDSLRTVIQSIILPRNLTLDAMAEVDGLSWLVEAKSDDVQEFDDYNKLVQIPVEHFDPGSLNMVKLHDNGAFAVVGKLESDEGLEDALVLGSREMKAALPLPVSPMDTTIAEGPQVPAYLMTFRQMFEKELMSFLDVVNGAMGQSNSTAEARKDTVMRSLDAFRTFMSVGLDALAESVGGSAKGKSDKGAADLQLVQEQLIKMQDTIKQALEAEKEGGNPTMFQFETKEAFEDSVKSIITGVLEAQKTAEAEAQAKAEADAAAAAAAGKTGDAVSDDTIKSVMEQLKTLGETVNGLAQKTETLSQSFASKQEPEGGDGDGKKQVAKTIFGGLLIRK